jgi:hypothetical protein
VAFFSGHLMLHLSTKFNKTCTQMMACHLTTQQPRRRPKVANPTNLSAVTCSCHDGNFELTVGIIPGRIKGQDLAPLNKKCPSSTPYK